MRPPPTFTRAPRRGARPTAAGAAAAVAVALAGCGDDLAPPDAEVAACGPPSDADILDQLRALPGVSAEELPGPNAPPGYRYLALRITQPVDHAAPGGATFTQHASLLHRGLDRPSVAYTTGYDDYQRDYLSEPAALVDGNQLSLEHRFFGASRPSPADWTTLTIRQAADDEHEVLARLRCVYRRPWVSSGGSKGGMTAIYHRRFYPDDVAGTLAYVAPLSFAVPDHRYDAFLDGVQPVACRDAVRAVAAELLGPRRAMVEQRATEEATARGLAYTRIALGPAVESALLDLEWSYWQYAGAAGCPTVPPATATDATLWGFLQRTSPVSFSADDETARFEAYFHQAYAQLGSPGTVHVRGDSLPAGLAALARYGDDAYAGTLPLDAPIPTHDPAAMQDIDAWVQAEGEHLAFVYGEQDPWSGGMFRLGAARDALRVETPAGTHGDGIVDLSPADRAAVVARLSAWTGVPVAARTLGRGAAPPPPTAPHRRRGLR